ncbi:MAG: hypothetical protein ONB44_10645 [candidate division KSB1 bacterium]|nr:hypothetical protein [candidate division KSB1 bacterium]
MSPRFAAAGVTIFFSLCLIDIGTVRLGMIATVLAQEEAGTQKPETDEKPREPEKPPFDEKIARLVYRYETEISFLLPEGEFDAAFEKKFGYFSTQAQARYNFLRGEMGFSLQNIYTKFRIVPQVRVHDRLNFVHLFSSDRLWRREQGLKLGARIFVISPINTLTSFNYQRFSFPSTINIKELESQQVHSVSQAFGMQADSARFLGAFHSGLFELEIIHAFPFSSDRADFWQFQILMRGISENSWIATVGEAQIISLISGRGVPFLFLGGRNRLSAYRTNEFAGINLFYFSQLNRFHLNKKKSLGLIRDFSIYELDFVVHTEVGQTGGDARMRDLAAYHLSVGCGFSGITAYRQRRAFEIFFHAYQGLEHGQKPRYYFGIKY